MTGKGDEFQLNLHGSEFELWDINLNISNLAFGGAISIHYTNTNLSDCTFTSNTLTGGFGGGATIYALNSHATVNRCEFFS